MRALHRLDAFLHRTNLNITLINLILGTTTYSSPHVLTGIPSSSFLLDTYMLAGIVRQLSNGLDVFSSPDVALRSTG